MLPLRSLRFGAGVAAVALFVMVLGTQQEQECRERDGSCAGVGHRLLQSHVEKHGQQHQQQTFNEDADLAPTKKSLFHWLDEDDNNVLNETEFQVLWPDSSDAGNQTRKKSSCRDAPSYRRPYTQLLFKNTSYASRCAWAKARSGCSWRLTMMSKIRYSDKCAKTCTGKGLDDPALSSGRYYQRPSKRQKYSSGCAWNKIRGYCHTPTSKRLCRKTCTGRGSDIKNHHWWSRPITTWGPIRLGTKNYTSRCDWVKEEGQCKHPSHKHSCNKTCGECGQA